MKISMDLIYRDMKDTVAKKIANQHFFDMIHMSVSPICALTKAPRGHLIFGHASDFPSDLMGESIISIGDLPSSVTGYNDVIIIDSSYESDYIYQRLLDVFERYENWRNMLHDSIMQEKNLQQIAELSLPIFNNPILIHDMNFNVLAYTEANYQREMVIQDNEDLPIISMDVINDFKIDQEYQQTLHTIGPSMFSEGMFGFRALYINLWVEQQYVGRVVVSEISNPFIESDEALLQYLADFITSSFRLGYYRLSEKSRHLKNIFRKLIGGEEVDVKQLQRNLNLSGWAEDDRYLCACLITDDRDIHTNTIRSVSLSLELQFPQSCIFNYHNNIIIVVDIDLERKKLTDISSELGVFLREGLLKVGFSSIGHDFSRMKYYYQQAISAYETGTRIDNSFWQYRFDDYVLSYIFDIASEKFPKEMIISQDVLILKKYDDQHQSELYRTLQLYLESSLNLTKTASALDIHRSTLLYRIDRIKQLIDFDVEDVKQRFFLLWSYYLLES